MKLAKGTGAAVFGLSLAIFAVQPAWARQCPKVIKEARDLLGAAKLSQGDADKVRAMLDEAQRLHDAGSHTESLAKAREALGLVKK
jgi:hypothetical protein